MEKFLGDVAIINLDSRAVEQAVKINNMLKIKRKQIAFADLMIAAIALNSNLPLATLNRKHFERVEALQIID